MFTAGASMQQCGGRRLLRCLVPAGVSLHPDVGSIVIIIIIIFVFRPRYNAKDYYHFDFDFDYYVLFQCYHFIMAFSEPSGGTQLSRLCRSRPLWFVTIWLQTWPPRSMSMTAVLQVAALLTSLLVAVLLPVLLALLPLLLQRAALSQRLRTLLLKSQMRLRQYPSMLNRN